MKKTKLKKSYLLWRNFNFCKSAQFSFFQKIVIFFQKNKILEFTLTLKVKYYGRY